MAFDGKKHVQDRLTHLADERKQAEAKRDAALLEAETALTEIDSEIAFWRSLAAPAPVAKKAAAKK